MRKIKEIRIILRGRTWNQCSLYIRKFLSRSGILHYITIKAEPKEMSGNLHRGVASLAAGSLQVWGAGGEKGKAASWQKTCGRQTFLC